MLMNEKEARTKWCPMFRGHGGQNDWSREGSFRTCLGCDCAMWRDSGQTDNGGRDGKPLGYCGLAGKPVGLL